MRKPIARRSLRVIVIAGMVASVAAGAPAARAVTDRAEGSRGQASQPHAKKALYDARKTPAAQKALRALAPQRAASAAAAAAALRSKLGNQGLLSIDPLTGTVRMIGRTDGFLTSPSKATPQAIALGYVTTNATALGLTTQAVQALNLVRDYADIEGTHHLFFQQRIAGVPVFGNGLKAAVTKDGRLVNVVGSPLANFDRATSTARISASQAIAAARRDAAVSGGSATKQVYFRTVEGTRLAYQTIVGSGSEMFLSVIDATDSRLLYRRSLVNNDTADVLENYPNAPLGGTRHRVTLDQWLNQGATTLSGPNAHVYSDVNDSNTSSANEETTKDNTSNFNYPFTEFQGPACPPGYPCSWNPDKAFSWKTNRAQSATQLFYFINKFHDHLAKDPIGFTPAAGNFQGSDAVNGENIDGANVNGDGFPDFFHTDNANFSTPPDGTPGRMQMYLFHEPGLSYPDEDPFIAGNSSDEASIVYHENTHGLSNRLVVDSDGNSTIASIQAASMGEGWSDWYALDFLGRQGLMTDTSAPGEMAIGLYTAGGQSLFRTQPLDCPVGSTDDACPGGADTGPGGYTYGDYGKVIGFPEVHAEGEIWAETLWDLRTAVGSFTAERLVTRAMELSPADPTMLDMRNAILQADAVGDGRWSKTVWTVFAHRGMGYFAGAIDGGDVTPAEDFSLPPAPGTPTGTLKGLVTNQETGSPIPGITVAFAGHDSGFGADLAATTNAAGNYTINGITYGTYPKVFAIGAGFDINVVPSMTISTPSKTKNFQLRRDWASIFGGADVTKFDPPDYSNFGCGPNGAIDQNLGSGWGSDTGATDQPDGTAVPKHITIKLPTAIDISEVAVDPAATCGDGGSASTRRYRIEVSTTGVGLFKDLSSGIFYAGNRGHLNSVALKATAVTNVRYLRFTMITPQVPFSGDACTGPADCGDGGVPQRCGPDAPDPGDFSGCQFMDMSEIEVYGSPH